MYKKIKKIELKSLYYHFFVGILLIFLILIIFSDIIFSENPLVISGLNGDIYSAYVYTRGFSLNEIKNCNIPLWNPYAYCGSSFIADPENAMYYPINIIYLFLPLHIALNLDMLLHLFLTGLFMYIWTYNKKLHPLACIFSAIVLMFSGAYYLRIFAGHLNILASASWMPLIFLCIDNIVKNKNLRWSLPGIAFVALSIFAGNIQYVFFATLTCLGYTIILVIKSKEKKVIILGFVYMYAGGFILTAIHIFPVLGFMSESYRSDLSYLWRSSFPFEFANLITLIVPNFFGDMKLIEPNLTYWGNWSLWEQSIFIGVIAFTFFIYSVLTNFKKIRGLFLLLIVLFIISFGNNTPFYDNLIQHLPLFSNIRGLCKLLFSITFLFAFIAGLGFDTFIKSKNNNMIIYIILTMFLILVLSSIIINNNINETNWQSFIETVRTKEWSNKLIIDKDFIRFSKSLATNEVFFSGLIALLLAGVIFITNNYYRHAFSLVLLLAIIEMSYFALRNKSYFDIRLIENKDLEQLKSIDKSDFRVYLTGGTARSIKSRISNIDDENTVYLTKRYQSFFEFLSKSNTWKLNKENIFIDSTHISEILRLKYILAEINNETMLFTLNGNIFPHISLFYDFAVIKNEELILHKMFSNEYDLRNTLILEELPKPFPGKTENNGYVRIKEASTNFIILEAETLSPSLIFITDSYSKGWKASPIKGSIQEEYKILKADFIFMAIPIKAGKHKIILEYSPLSYRIGKWITIVSLCIYMLVLIKSFTT